MAIIFRLLCFAVLFLGSAAAAATNEERLAAAIKLFEARTFTSAFAEFEDLCVKNKYAPGCFMLAKCYQSGLGVAKNYNEAFVIYRSVAKGSKNPKLQAIASYQAAHILEYEKGGEPGNLEKAGQVYHELEKLSFGELRPEIKAALLRQNEYKFIREVFPAISDFNRQKIDYAKLRDCLDNADIKLLPDATARKFLDLKHAILTYARDRQDIKAPDKNSNDAPSKRLENDIHYQDVQRQLAALIAQFSKDKISPAWFLAFTGGRAK